MNKESMLRTGNYATEAQLSTGRGWLWLGVGVALMAIVLNIGQMFLLHQLTTPWYLPVFGSIGAGLVLWSFIQRRTVGRLVVFLFFGLLAGFEWFLLLSFHQTPAYAGPAAGDLFPAFQAKRANGEPFTDADLKADKDTVLVLFRGHW